MNGVRNGLAYLLSALLFFALLAGTTAASISIAFSHPDKLETWLAQSGLYSSFVDNAIKQASSSTSGDGQPSDSTGVSLNDVAVQQAAQSAFSPVLLQHDVNTFLDSNYAWLEGKTQAPSFIIDLTDAKQTFAQKVGQYVQAHLSSLPVCTAAQVESQPTSDPLSMTCRPSVLDPAAAGAQVTQELTNNGSFLSNPVITAQSINPNGGATAQPYYEQLAYAPRLYRLAVSLPWILGGVALLAAAAIVFLTPSKRKGSRRVGWTLLEAGLLLIVLKFVIDAVVKRIEAKAFNQASIGPLQHSLTIFANKAESQLVHINLYAGGAFLVLAVITFVVLIVTRQRGIKTPRSLDVPATAAAPSRAEAATPANQDTAPAGQAADDKPAKPKRPRLIQ